MGARKWGGGYEESGSLSISSNAHHDDPILKIFNRSRAAISVVHCPAFPGAPRYDGPPDRGDLPTPSCATPKPTVPAASTG